MTNENKLKCAYLIPSDMTNEAEQAIVDALQVVRAWLRWRMAGGRTISLDDPIVQVYQTDHDAEWYSQYGGPFGTTPFLERYSANVQTDARDYAGATYYQPNYSWVIYCAAPLALDENGNQQHAGGTESRAGYGSGLCIMHGRDIDALLERDPEWTHCREIGGLTHETLHTFGLPHPPPGPDFGKAVMGSGYTIFPDCILTDADKATLGANRFFINQPRLHSPSNLCPFDDKRPNRPPRPPFGPHPRP